MGTKKYANYYKDIAKLDIDEKDEYNNLLEKYNKEDRITDQIIINSKICDKKDLFLRIGIVSLIPFSLLLFILICLTIFV